jgi:hypothetical protein
VFQPREGTNKIPDTDLSARRVPRFAIIRVMTVKGRLFTAGRCGFPSGRLVQDARAARHHHSAILRHRNLFAVSGFPWDGSATVRTWVMTENTHHDATRRNHLLEAAHEEMVKFERKENEFRRKDREERAAELRLPLNEIKVH